MWTLLLLAATVRSFAHMRSGFPIATKWCCDQDVKVVRSSADRNNCKNKGMFCNFSVGVALKVWFLHAQYMKMTRDEHVLGFKSCDISIYWWICMLSFLLKQNWIVIDDFLLNLFATFDSVLGMQITVGLQVDTELILLQCRRLYSKCKWS